MKTEGSHPITEEAADCTAQLQAECDRLAYLESIWRLAVDSADQGAWDYNAVTNSRFHSEGWKRIRGMRADDEPYSSYEEWFQKVHPDDQKFVGENVAARDAGEKSEWEFSYRELTVDGRWVWILSRGRVVAYDDNGRPARVLGTDIDITEVKERELRQSAFDKRTYEIHVASLRSAHIEVEEARQTAVRLANSDQLSDLPNRRHFLQRVQELLHCDGIKFGVLILDVDDFKKINDQHGHAAGDYVIFQTARRLVENFPKSHLIARLGGDEFGLIVDLPDAETVETLEVISARVSKVMGEPIHQNGVPLTSGCSVGASMHPRDGVSVSQLLKCADLALYRAKSLGKGRSVVFDTSLGWQADQQNLIEMELRHAIRSKIIKPYYQPILHVRSGEVVALEALARWECKRLGSVMPDVFLPVAEKLGLLQGLTDCIFEQAADFAKSIPDGIRLTFNLNPAEVCDLTTPLRVSSLLRQSGLPANRILIEVTEKALARNIFVARQVIGALRAQGIRIYLDDFGAGYSGLCHLKDLQVDGLKFDKSFAQTVISNPASQVILRCMFDMAHKLKLDTIVEGVESTEALELVKTMGANLCQGFHFARPLNAEKAAYLFAPRAGVAMRHQYS